MKFRTKLRYKFANLVVKFLSLFIFPYAEIVGITKIIYNIYKRRKKIYE